MLTLPDAIISVLQPFSSMFRQRTWAKAQLLLVGAILARASAPSRQPCALWVSATMPASRSITTVLNRAVWSPLQLSRVLLMLLIEHLAQDDEPWCSASTRRWNEDAAVASTPRECFETPCAPPSRIWSEQADCAGSSRELPSEGGSPTQEDHRLGTTDDYPTAPLAARPQHSRRGRQGIRSARTPCTAASPAPASHLHQRTQTRCCALRARSTQNARADR